MGASESQPFLNELSGYRIIQKIPENNLTHLSHTETDKQYLLRQLTYNDEKLYKRTLDQHKMRQSLVDDHLIHLGRVQGKEIDHLCSNLYKVWAIWEYPFRFLADQINERVYQNRKFEDREISSILASSIFALSTLQKNKIKHEMLTTRTILLDSQGLIKIVDPLACGSPTNFDTVHRNRNSSQLYLSPQQCQALQSRGTYTNPYKSDVFVLGMIILECGLLESMSKCYRDQFQRVDYEMLGNKIGLFGREYGEELRLVLAQMLKPDNKDRPDWIDMAQYARKFGDRVGGSAGQGSKFSSENKELDSEHKNNYGSGSKDQSSYFVNQPQPMGKSNPSGYGYQGQRTELGKGSFEVNNNVYRPVVYGTVNNSTYTNPNTNPNTTTVNPLPPTRATYYINQPTTEPTYKVQPQQQPQLQPQINNPPPPVYSNYQSSLNTTFGRPMAEIKPAPYVPPVSQPISFQGTGSTMYGGSIGTGSLGYQPPLFRPTDYQYSTTGNLFPNPSPVPPNTNTNTSTNFNSYLGSTQNPNPTPNFTSQFGTGKQIQPTPIDYRRFDTSSLLAAKRPNSILDSPTSDFLKYDFNTKMIGNEPIKIGQTPLTSTTASSSPVYPFYPTATSYTPTLPQREVYASKKNEELFTPASFLQSISMPNTGAYKSNPKFEIKTRIEQPLTLKTNLEPNAKPKQQPQPQSQLQLQPSPPPPTITNAETLEQHMNTVQSNNQNTYVDLMQGDNSNADNQNEEGEPERPEYVVETFKQGSKYQGFKLRDMRHGQGKFYYQDGGMYDGMWSRNKMDGFGSLYYQSGELAYQGMWKQDQFQGKGKLFNEYPYTLQGEFNYENFDQIDQYWSYYEGDFVEDFKKGKGKLMLQNGEYFQGTFDNDMVEGPGVFHCKNGKVIKGIWRQNHLISK